MNVFHIAKEIVEFLYYIAGIAALYLIYSAIKKDRLDAAKEYSKKISQSQKEYMTLKDKLKKEIEKDENGNSKKYSNVYFNSDIKQYFTGNGNLRTFKYFDEIKNNEYNELKETIKDIMELLKGSIYFLKESEIENNFIGDFEDFLSCTIIPLTIFNYNYKYKEEIEFIVKKLGVEKIDQRTLKNNLWKELCKS